LSESGGAFRKKAYPLAMLLVGFLFISLGVFRYPMYIVVGGLYVTIGIRGLSFQGKLKLPKTKSNKAQFESL
jgi:uncharacterized membrane protein YeiH